MVRTPFLCRVILEEMITLSAIILLTQGEKAMGTKITLTLPDDLYRQVEQIAQTANRPMQDVLIDSIIQSFPKLHTHDKRAVMEQERQAFEAMYAELLKQYEGQYVAIHQGQVVDHDRDQLALLRRRKQNYPEEIVLIAQVTPNSQRVLHFRSPRLINPA